MNAYNVNLQSSAGQSPSSPIFFEQLVTKKAYKTIRKSLCGRIAAHKIPCRTASARKIFPLVVIGSNWVDISHTAILSFKISNLIHHATMNF